MKGNGKAVGIVFLICLLWIYFNFDFFASIVPGWNTTIHPIWKILLAIVIVAFVFSIIISVFFTIIRNIFRQL